MPSARWIRHCVLAVAGVTALAGTVATGAAAKPLPRSGPLKPPPAPPALTTSNPPPLKKAAGTTATPISACSTLYMPGTYYLATNISDTTSGPCIVITASNVTLYLNGNQMTGDSPTVAGQVAISVVGNQGSLTDDVIDGTPDKVRGTPRGPAGPPCTSCPKSQIINFDNGIYAYATVRLTVTNLTIIDPPGSGGSPAPVHGQPTTPSCPAIGPSGGTQNNPGANAFFAEYAVYSTIGDTTAKGLAGIDVQNGDNGGDAFQFYCGTDNTVANATDTYSNQPEPSPYKNQAELDSFYTNYEYGDRFLKDTSRYVANNQAGTRGTGALPAPTDGGAGTGFYDDGSNRDSFIGDRSDGNMFGFYFDEQSLGVVSASGNLADDAAGSDRVGMTGFYLDGAYPGDNPWYRGPFTSLDSNNASGFDDTPTSDPSVGDGYYDGGAPEESYTNNHSSLNSNDGYLFNMPADGYIVGNHSASDQGVGFLITNNYDQYNVRQFSGNTSNGDYVGFRADFGVYPGDGVKAGSNTYTGCGTATYNVDVKAQPSNCP